MRLNELTLVAPVLLFLLGGFASQSQATSINFDFEDQPVESYNGALVSRGFVFDSGIVNWSPGAPEELEIGHYHIAGASETSWMANNGTNYMVFDYFSGYTRMNVYSRVGTTFGLSQVDVGEALILSAQIDNDGKCWPTDSRYVQYVVAFTGHLAGGDTISRTVALDMVCDGSGPLVDFQRFEFDYHWNGLEMLTIQQLTYSDSPESWLGIDNLVLRAVPEPGSLALLSFGLAGLAFTRRRKQ